MTAMRGWLAVGLVAVATCSGESPTGPSRVDRQVILAPGQTTIIREASVVVRFLQVSADFRCPSSVMCVSAGNALVQIEAQSSRATPRSYELRTFDGRTVLHDGLAITLVQLAPYPVTTGSIAPGDYRATLNLSR